ncbi:MAG: terminase small subunit [Rhodobacteraceae bacterium]|nr:terminase small subunit [Paracoccaceae bacterium]
MSNFEIFGDLLGDEISPAEAPYNLSGAIPPELNESGLATLLGVGASRIRTLARDGVLVRGGKGRFDTRKSLQGYLENLRVHAARAGRPSEGGDALKKAKTRLAEEQAAKAELQNAALRAELVESSVVQREWQNILRDVRSTVLAVPSRVGAKLPHLTAHDVAEIDREIKSALEALANGR